MYTLEQRQFAVDIYLQLKSQRKTIRAIGYPGSRTILQQCISEYKTNGKLSKKVYKNRKPIYSDEQIITAINYWMNNGMNITKTCNDLGYPSRVVLSSWLDKKVPDRNISV